MKNLIAITCALLLAATMQTVSAQQNTAKINEGDKVPSFTVTMLDGRKINIESLRGKVVLVNFWATWCPPCRLEMQRIPKEIVERFAGQDFVLLAISRGETNETINKFISAQGYTFPIGTDPDTSIFRMFAENSIPRSFLIGRDGTVVKTELGYSEESFDEIVNTIDKLLKTK